MLNKHNFEIAELAPQDEERLTLCGIYVTPNGTMETDGHQAVIVSDVQETQPNLFDAFADVNPSEDFKAFILDRESALKIAKAIPKRDPDAPNQANQFAVVDAVTDEGDRATVSVNDLFRQEILRARKISGDFPDILRVFPPEDEAVQVLMLNPDLLLGVLKVFAKFCKGRGAGAIEVRMHKTGRPLTILADGDGQKMTAAIMPLRSGTEDEQA